MDGHVEEDTDICPNGPHLPTVQIKQEKEMEFPDSDGDEVDRKLNINPFFPGEHTGLNLPTTELDKIDDAFDRLNATWTNENKTDILLYDGIKKEEGSYSLDRLQKRRRAGAHEFKDGEDAANENSTGNIVEVKKEDNSDNEVRYTCPECGKEFRRDCTLQKHLKTHTFLLFDCRICGKTYKSKAHYLNAICYKCLKAERKGKTRKYTVKSVFQCKPCNALFRTGQALKAHKQTFHKMLEFACTSCSETFAKKVNLNFHFLAAHPDEALIDKKSSLKRKAVQVERSTWYCCKRCGQKVSNRLELTLHHQEHLADGEHFCTFCGEMFANRKKKRLHERFHKGQYEKTVAVEKESATGKHKCRICDECFDIKGSMISHEICVHSL